MDLKSSEMSGGPAYRAAKAAWQAKITEMRDIPRSGGIFSL
jgi:hypothetical protein